MSKKTDYTTLADGFLAKAAEAKGEARSVLLAIEAGWRRLALACFDTAFGPEPVEPRTPPRLRLARSRHQ